jgi:hypothetical protein
MGGNRAAARTRLEARGPRPDDVLAAALGTRFLEYRAAFREAEAGRLPPFPVHLDVDVTTRCQLRCPICPAGAGGAGYPGMGLDLDPALYARALEEGLPKGLASVRLGVTGEPLLADRVDLWAAEAAGRGAADVSLITNGQLLDPQASRRLVRAGLTRLMVSADAGSEEGYRRARPGGDFRRLLENLRAFLAERASLGRAFPVLRVSFVEREGWEAERELFRAKFSPLADYLSFQSYSPVVERGRLAAGRLADVPDRPAGGGARAAGGGARAAGGGARAAGGAGRPPESLLRPPRCGEPYTRMCLYADGGLFPCCSDYGRLGPVGSLLTCTIEEAWLSPAAGLTRGPGPPRHPACALCSGDAGPPEAGAQRAAPPPAGTEDATEAAGDGPPA